MSQLMFREGVAIAKDGTELIAKAAICGNCKQKSFMFFWIGASMHPHLECVNCGTSYCTNSEECRKLNRENREERN